MESTGRCRSQDATHEADPDPVAGARQSRPSIQARAFGRVRNELVERFGGLTAYSRSPARGLWKTGRATKRDDMIVLEVMTPHANRAWWRRYRRKLETMFRQDEIVIRSQTIELL